MACTKHDKFNINLYILSFFSLFVKRFSNIRRTFLKFRQICEVVYKVFTVYSFEINKIKTEILYNYNEVICEQMPKEQ